MKTPNPANAPAQTSPEHPPLAADTPREYAATRDWMAHIAAGRIQVR